MFDKHGECDDSNGLQVLDRSAEYPELASADIVPIPFTDVLGIETVPPPYPEPGVAAAYLRQSSPVSCARDGVAAAGVPDAATDNGQIDSLAMQD